MALKLFFVLPALEKPAGLQKGKEGKIVLHVIELRVVSVSREDPNWLKKQFWEFPSVVNISPDMFPDYKKWPDVVPCRKYALAWFEGETFSGFDAVDRRLLAEGIGSERRTFPPELVTVVVPRCDELWELSEQGEGPGPGDIYPSSPLSLWRGSEGSLCLPHINLHPKYRWGLDVSWVGGGLYNSSFLVACEL